MIAQVRNLSVGILGGKPTSKECVWDILNSKAVSFISFPNIFVVFMRYGDISIFPFKLWFFGEWPCEIPGIYPDLLHVLDLAIYVDGFASALLHWTDRADIFEGRSRDERLTNVYRHYLPWCVENRPWKLARNFFWFLMFPPKKRNGSVEHGIGWNFQFTRERPSLDDVYVYTVTNLSRQYMWTHTCAYTHTYLHSQINMDTYMHINKKYGYSGKPIEGPSSQQIQTVCVGTLV